MRGKLYHLSVVVLMAAGVLCGCKSTTPVQEKPHPDPLCVSKKPLEGKPLEPGSEGLFRVDPQAPPIPMAPGSAIVRQPAVLGAPQPAMLPAID